MASAQTFPSSSFRTPHPKLHPLHLPLYRPTPTSNSPPSTPPPSPPSAPASSVPPKPFPPSAAKPQTASCAGAKSSEQSTPSTPLAGRVSMAICACHRRSSIQHTNKNTAGKKAKRTGLGTRKSGNRSGHLRCPAMSREGCARTRSRSGRREWGRLRFWVFPLPLRLRLVVVLREEHWMRARAV